MSAALRSLRLRVPLSLVLVTLLTFLFVSIAIGIQTSINLQADQERSLTAQAHALAPILTEALLHDDVWTAYTALRGRRSPPDAQTPDAPFHLVLDEQGRIFVSDRPGDFPLGTPLQATPLGRALAAHLGGGTPRAVSQFAFDDRQLVHAPLLSEDAPVGALLIAGPRGAIHQRLLEILGGGLLVMLMLLLVIVPLGWLWGSRLVHPLVQLAACMRQVGRRPMEALECPIEAGRDEIGDLARGFQSMLAELRDKQALERQMIAQDRLAAIGRIAGGVAHEINNPLAGMLVAIDNYRRTPPQRRDPERTLALIERGLGHIRDTVSALLVECRVEQRRCSPDDIEDVHRLILADDATRRVRLEWDNRLRGELPLPATAIRQILLNLVLNAVQAAGESPPGEVAVTLERDRRHLRMQVRNSGEPIPQAELERIFEPFRSGRPGGTGLGLWITYQIVEQLAGEIVARSDEAATCFEVSLPFPHDAAEAA